MATRKPKVPTVRQALHELRELVYRRAYWPLPVRKGPQRELLPTLPATDWWRGCQELWQQLLTALATRGWTAERLEQEPGYIRDDDSPPLRPEEAALWEELRRRLLALETFLCCGNLFVDLTLVTGSGYRLEDELQAELDRPPVSVLLGLLSNQWGDTHLTRILFPRTATILVADGMVGIWEWVPLDGLFERSQPTHHQFPVNRVVQFGYYTYPDRPPSIDWVNPRYHPPVEADHGE